MSYSLLLDFGATRIKSALYEHASGQLLDVQSRPCTQNHSSQAPYFEIPLAGLIHDFQSVCEAYTTRHNYKQIFICSQMHGFVLTDENFTPLTDYISWQDERALLPVGQEPSSWELFDQAFATSFQQITGMRLRMGFPAVKVLDFLRKNPGRNVYVLSLPEALLLGQKSKHNVHITMAAGSGLIDFNTRQPSPVFLDFLEQHSPGSRVLFQNITSEIVPAGEITIKGRTITVYTGVGDHQCAVWGAGNTLETLSFNIGTGSQVSAICTQASADNLQTERRHFFDNLELQTITHIPAGRVLAGLMDFYHTLTGRDGWAQFQTLTRADLQEATLQFNLAFFPDAWGFKPGAGSLSGLTLQGLTEKNFWASLFRSFAQQYISAAHQFTPGWKKIMLSGGKLAKYPLLKQYVEENAKTPVQVTPSAEETLTGLCLLADTTLTRRK